MPLPAMGKCSLTPRQPGIRPVKPGDCSCTAVRVSPLPPTNHFIIFSFFQSFAPSALMTIIYLTAFQPQNLCASSTRSIKTCACPTQGPGASGLTHLDACFKRRNPLHFSIACSQLQLQQVWAETQTSLMPALFWKAFPYCPRILVSI